MHLHDEGQGKTIRSDFCTQVAWWCKVTHKQRVVWTIPSNPLDPPLAIVVGKIRTATQAVLHSRGLAFYATIEFHRRVFFDTVDDALSIDTCQVQDALTFTHVNVFILISPFCYLFSFSFLIYIHNIEICSVVSGVLFRLNALTSTDARVRSDICPG